MEASAGCATHRVRLRKIQRLRLSNRYGPKNDPIRGLPIAWGTSPGIGGSVYPWRQGTIYCSECRSWPVYEKPTYPANLCLFSWWIEFAGFREDFGKTVGESVQTAAGSAIGQVAPVHLHYVLSGKQGVHYSAQAGVGRGDL